VANKIYSANAFSGDATALTEQALQEIPLVTQISPNSFTGLQSTFVNPIFTLTPQSNYFPIAPGADAVYFQVDSWQGVWTKATLAGVFTGQTPSLTLGDHVLFAYSGDGSEASALSRNVTVIGQIASYPFTVIASNSVPPQIVVNVPNATVTVTRGGSATYTLQVSAQGTLPEAVTFSCGNLPAETTCTFVPASVNATSTPTTVTLTITTTAPSVAMNMPETLRGLRMGVAFAILAPVAGFFLPWVRRTAGRNRMALIPAAFAFLLFAGCGGGSSGTMKTPTGGTPTGSFDINVVSAAGSVQATAVITLEVQ